MALDTLRQRLAAWADGDRRPRLGRRVAVRCPHTGALVTIDVQTEPGGIPRPVLRCSADPAFPPRCDQGCRAAGEVRTGPALALLILPPGHGVPAQPD
jgi:hypothetical protein